MKLDSKKVRSKDVNWEEEYKTSQTKLWAQGPHTYSRLAAKYVKKGNVLDIGSGEGYDCLFFAQKGYNVTAIDISQTAITKLLSTAKKLRLKIMGLVKDVRTSTIKNKFNIIVSYRTLQFLGLKFKKYLANLKKKTLINGVHAFYIFGNEGDFYLLAKHRFYFPSEKELKQLYEDWEIIKFQKKNTRLLINGDKGEILYNVMFKILARKVN